MQLHFTLTPLELGEAIRPVRPPAKSKLVAIFVYIILLVLAFVCLAVFSMTRSAERSGAAQAQPALQETPGPQNLWSSLTASLIAVLYLVGLFTLSQRNRRQLVRDPTAPAHLSTLHTILMLSPFLLIFLPQVSSLAVVWHPSENEQVWAGLAPWLVLFFVFSFNQRRRRRTGNKAVETNPGLLRPRTITLVEEGFRSEDGVIDVKVHWSYFVRCRETPNLLLLIAEDARATIIPKRAIPGPAEFVAIKSLLQNRVVRCDFVQSVTGFSVLPPPPSPPLPVMEIPPQA